MISDTLIKSSNKDQKKGLTNFHNLKMTNDSNKLISLINQNLHRDN